VDATAHDVELGGALVDGYEGQPGTGPLPGPFPMPWADPIPQP
jgi:hypothetical protein